MPIAPRRACSEPGCLDYAVRVGRCTPHAAVVVAAQEARRKDVTAGRSWYHTPRWHALRLSVLRVEPLCRACVAQGRPVPAVDVDHIAPHLGDLRKFWDRANLQPLCKPCHYAKTAGERKRAAIARRVKQANE